MQTDRSKLPPGVAEEEDVDHPISRGSSLSTTATSNHNNTNNMCKHAAAVAFTRPSATRGYQPTIASARPAPIDPRIVKTSSELTTHLTRCGTILGNDMLVEKMPGDKAKELIKRYAALMWYGCGLRNLSPLVSQKSSSSNNKNNNEIDESSSSASVEEINNMTPLERAQYYVITHTTTSSSSSSFSPEMRQRICTAIEELSLKSDDAASVQLSLPTTSTTTTTAADADNRESYHNQHSQDKVISFQEALMETQRFQRVNLHEQLTRSFGDLLSKTEITRLVAISSEKLLLTFDESQKMEERFANIERQALMRRLRQRMALLEQQRNPQQSAPSTGGASSTTYDHRDFGTDEDEDDNIEDEGAVDVVAPHDDGHGHDDDDEEGGADVGANPFYSTGVRSMEKDGTVNGVEEDED